MRGQINEGWSSRSGGNMGIFPCIIEAAVALHAPVALWPYGKNFAYDPAVQEWSFREDYLDRPEAWTDLKEWLERMCGWLQYKYPAGPKAMESTL